METKDIVRYGWRNKGIFLGIIKTDAAEKNPVSRITTLADLLSLIPFLRR
jgi:hypothetical protein